MLLHDTGFLQQSASGQGQDGQSPGAGRGGRSKGRRPRPASISSSTREFDDSASHANTHMHAWGALSPSRTIGAASGVSGNSRHRASHDKMARARSVSPPFTLLSGVSPTMEGRRKYATAGRRAAGHIKELHEEVLQGAPPRSAAEVVSLASVDALYEPQQLADTSGQEDEMAAEISLRNSLLSNVESIRTALLAPELDKNAAVSASATVINALVKSNAERRRLLAGEAADDFVDANDMREVKRQLQSALAKGENLEKKVSELEVSLETANGRIEQFEAAAAAGKDGKGGGMVVIGNDEAAVRMKELQVENNSLQRKVAEGSAMHARQLQQIKVLESRLKDAHGGGGGEGVPAALLQLRGRWTQGEGPALGGLGIGLGPNSSLQASVNLSASSKSFSASNSNIASPIGKGASPTRLANGSSFSATGGLNATTTTVGSSADDPVVLQAEIQKVAADVVTLRSALKEAKEAARKEHVGAIEARTQQIRAQETVSELQATIVDSAAELERARTSKAELQTAVEEEKRKFVRLKLAMDEVMLDNRTMKARVNKQADYIQKQEAVWRRIKAQYGGATKAEGEGGGADDTKDPNDYVPSPLKAEDAPKDSSDDQSEPHQHADADADADADASNAQAA